MNAPPAKRPPVIPLVETLAWQGRELDIHTVDRGPDHLFILTNLYVDGQLLVTRRVPYISTSDAERVAAVMLHHQRRLLEELKSGALDQELKALFEGSLPWARAPTPPPTTPLPPATTPPPPPQGLTPLPVPLQPRPSVGVVKTPISGVTELLPPGPPSLSVVLEEPAALLPFLFTQGRTRGIRVETAQHLDLGAHVEVAVRFLGRPIRQFYVPGTVTARRTAGHGSRLGDLSVTVAPADQLALDRVDEFARGIHDPTIDRQAPRVRCSLAIAVKLSNGRIQAGRVFNISEGGVMVGKMPPLMEGTRLTVEFTLPTGVALSLPAVVRWFRTDGEPLTGIQFTHVGESQAQIAAVVSQLLRTP